jgi:hypothetical protein
VYSNLYYTHIYIHDSVIYMYIYIYAICGSVRAICGSERRQGSRDIPISESMGGRRRHESGRRRDGLKTEDARWPAEEGPVLDDPTAAELRNHVSKQDGYGKAFCCFLYLQYNEWNGMSVLRLYVYLTSQHMCGRGTR